MFANWGGKLTWEIHYGMHRDPGFPTSPNKNKKVRRYRAPLIHCTPTSLSLL